MVLLSNSADAKNLNAINSADIKSVQIYKLGWELAPPVIKLGTSDKVVLSFDDLSGSAESYNYTITHCTPEWEDSGLSPAEYLKGFEVNQLQNYKYSYNTTYRYVHYELLLPNNDLNFRLSGNYIIKITKAGEEKPILTRRFYVLENMVSILSEVRTPLNANTSATHQEVNFTIDYTNLKITNPRQDISVVVQQNGREDNICSNILPTFIRANELVYNNAEGTMFEGGNEFRWIDIRSFKYLGARTSKIDFFDPFYHITVEPDYTRNYTEYLYRDDFYGKYVIAVTNGGEPTLEGDYAITHFSIPLDAPFIGASVNILGEAFGWQPTRDNAFNYNFDSHCYELSTLLKQGVYDYTIGVHEKHSDKIDFQRFEGNYRITENQYTFFVYLKKMGDSYSQLVGVDYANSIRN